ncbi:hypothetical protein TURU_040562 [Turdus rufiventris]|nr:hypothetical protein TURU_040562 [Turdus rufiventris]
MSPELWVPHPALPGTPPGMGTPTPPWAAPSNGDFQEEIPPGRQPEPPLAQPEAIPSHPVPVPWERIPIPTRFRSVWEAERTFMARGLMPKCPHCPFQMSFVVKNM